MRRSGAGRVRLLVVVTAVVGLVPLLGASAGAHRDGECWIYAERPYKLMNDGWFHGVGGIDCGWHRHARTRVRVDLLYSYRENGPYVAVASDVVTRRRARRAQADARIHPCDEDAGHGYYKTRTKARVFNAAGELVHRGRYTSRRRFLSNCVG